MLTLELLQKRNKSQYAYVHACMKSSIRSGTGANNEGRGFFCLRGKAILFSVKQGFVSLFLSFFLKNPVTFHLIPLSLQISYTVRRIIGLFILSFVQSMRSEVISLKITCLKYNRMPVQQFQKLEFFLPKCCEPCLLSTVPNQIHCGFRSAQRSLNKTCFYTVAGSLFVSIQISSCLILIYTFLVYIIWI